MKRIVFFIAVLAIISCKEEPKIDYAILSGKIVNSSAKDLSLIHISEPTRLVHSSRMPSSA